MATGEEAESVVCLGDDAHLQVPRRAPRGGRDGDARRLERGPCGGCEHVFAIDRHASIIHADVDAFFAAVEQRDDPAIRGRPVVVGAGVVMAASYEARAFGIRGGMGGGEARRRCPDLIAVPPRFEAYTAASREVFAIFREAAPVVEGLSLEEAFLDVAGLERIGGTPRQIAERLRRDVRRAAGLRDLGRNRLDEGDREDGEPRGEAGRPARDPARAASATSSTRSRSTGSGASGARPPLACTPSAWRPSPTSPSSRASTSSRSSAAPAVERLHALAHLRELRPVRRGRGRRSFGAQSAPGAPGALARGARTDPRPPGRAGHRPDAQEGQGGSDGRPSAPLRRLLTGHALADDAPGHRRDRRRPSRRPPPARRRPPGRSTSAGSPCSESP